MKAKIIAEIACAHLGDVEKCRTLITDASIAGADGVKLQIWSEPDIREHPSYKNMKRFELTRDEWQEMADTVDIFNLELWVEVISKESADFAATLNPTAFKIPYALFLKDPTLIDNIEQPVYWRTKTESPVYGEYVAIGEQGFPTSLAEAKHELELVKYYVETGRYVMYSDHQNAYAWRDNTLPSLAAYHAGADYIEKHICIDREELAKESKDHTSALEFNEFKKFIEFMRANERGGKVRAIL